MITFGFPNMKCSDWLALVRPLNFRLLSPFCLIQLEVQNKVHVLMQSSPDSLWMYVWMELSLQVEFLIFCPNFFPLFCSCNVSSFYFPFPQAVTVFLSSAFFLAFLFSFYSICISACVCVCMFVRAPFIISSTHAPH